MLNFIIFLLSTVGATLIVTQSFIFKKLREKVNKVNPIFGKLIKCSQCVGFYIAIFFQFLILFKERSEFIFYWTDIYYILYGFIGSAVCYIVYLLIKSLINKYD